MYKSLHQVTNILTLVGGWSILAAACLVTYDVITRKLFNISIAGADEISGYIFAVSTACAYSYALVTRANIRIDLIYNLMPQNLKRLLDFLSILSMAGFMSVVAYYAYDLVADAITYGSKSVTPLQTPLAIPQTLWFAALCFAILTALTLAILAFAALLRGDGEKVEKLIGIPSLEEEIKQELGEDEDEDEDEDDSGHHSDANTNQRKKG
ncbi:MAG: TRAP transporter small permease [Alphaproteobacteria bacterium]|nr:TRAP transporter small permease [Alphaproteobacteria bacterium]